MTETSRRVHSADGVGVAVYDSGPAGAPVVVAVHGYPDNHHVWDGVADQLRGELRVVRYDVRGTGASDHPRPVTAYRMPRLVDDLVAVVEAVSPHSPVHLLGHDWGSIQLWPALADPRLDGRIAGFTSVSGPSLDYARGWLRRASRHPVPALRQLAHSYYVALFQLPVLPELAIRSGLLDRAVEPTVPRTDADRLNGLKLYRANMLRRHGAAPPRPVTVPVQLVVAERDAFVTPQLAVESVRPWVAELTVHRLPDGHWVIARQPDVIAGLVRDFVGRYPPRPALSRPSTTPAVARHEPVEQ